MGEEAAGCWQLGQQPIHHHISAIWSHGSVTSDNKTSWIKVQIETPGAKIRGDQMSWCLSTNPNQNEIIVIVKYFWAEWLVVNLDLELEW